jgi:hypothetical protein
MKEVKRTPSPIPAWAIDPGQSIRATSLTVVVDKGTYRYFGYIDTLKYHDIS